MKISVVIPTYNSANWIQGSLSAIQDELGVDYESELIVTDDGSSDDTWLELSDFVHHSATPVRCLRLATNCGQHAALLAGIEHATGDVIVTLDDDLQYPPSEIPRLLDALSSDVDLVYGVVPNSLNSAWRRAGSKLTRMGYSSIGIGASGNLSPLRAFRGSLRTKLPQSPGQQISVDALLSWTTQRTRAITVTHQESPYRTSNYSLKRLIRFMIDTVTTYSTVPLRFATGLGLATIILSIGVLIYVISRPLMTGESVPGFPFLASTIAIFSGTQLLVLGILGQYIGRMHFRVMNKPTYTIAESTSQLPE